MAHVNVHEIPRSRKGQPPSKSLIESMTLEMARLIEDNKQLHAAIAIYREVLCRYTGQSTPPA